MAAFGLQYLQILSAGSKDVIDFCIFLIVIIITFIERKDDEDKSNRNRSDIVRITQ